MHASWLIGVLLACGAEPGAAAADSPADVDANTQAAVMRVLDEYMRQWNRADLAGWESTFHFPHYRLAGGRMRVLERPGDQPRPAIWGPDSQWHHSGWDRRQIVQGSPDKVHVDTRFTRYRADGSPIGSYDSLYIVTKENGHWGVKMRSSFAR